MELEFRKLPVQGPPLPSGEGRGEGNPGEDAAFQNLVRIIQLALPLTLTLSRRERGPRARQSGKDRK